MHWGEIRGHTLRSLFWAGIPGIQRIVYITHVNHFLLYTSLHVANLPNSPSPTTTKHAFNLYKSPLSTPKPRPLHPKRKTATPAEKDNESSFTVHLHSSELPMKLNNSFTHTIPAGYPNIQPNCSNGMTSARFSRASLITSLSADTTKTCSPVSANERQLSSSSIRLSARCFSFWPPPE